MAERGEGKRREAVGRIAAEVVVALWAVGLMGYYYYAKGYADLLRQIWRSFFG